MFRLLLEDKRKYFGNLQKPFYTLEQYTFVLLLHASGPSLLADFGFVHGGKAQ